MLQQVLKNAVANDNDHSLNIEYEGVHKRLRMILSSLDELYPLIERLGIGPYVHWHENSITPMHRWFRYREAYSPELIDKLGLGKHILDPFSGCGSILVGAAERGRQSVGIDLNPVASFSTKVKLTRLSANQLRQIETFEQHLEDICNSANRWPLPKLSIVLKVFEPEILDTLQLLRGAIESVSHHDRDVRDFLLLAWVSVLETVGSYFKEGNGIKYRNKKRHKGHYENRAQGQWQMARFGADQRAFVIAALRKQLKIMLEDTEHWKQGSWGEQKIIEGNAFDLEHLCNSQKFDSIVFSPPYANRFDYFESFKVELWFGGFVNTYEDMNALRKASLRSHLGADFRRSYAQIEPLEALIELMDRDASSWRMGVADLLRGYFHDLYVVLEQCRRVMPQGRCHVVVGNSAFAGVIIPTDILTAIVASKAGFRSARLVETRHLTVAPQQRNRLHGFESYMRETIVVLE
jgi:site-specific DNA-methyltransferase (adenine-specific)